MTIHNIPPERFYEMSWTLFQLAGKQNQQYLSPYGYRRTNRWAEQIGHIAGLAWLAHEAGEAAEREKL